MAGPGLDSDTEYVSAAGLSEVLTPSATVADSQLEDPDVRAPKSYQTTILNSHHDKFRKKLNFRSILSLLNEKGLIPHEEYRELLNIPQTDTNHDRIDRLFAIIPSCDHDDFLMRLIHCLRESVPEAGDAHTELADSLQVALNGYSPVASVLPPSSKENKTGGNKEEDGSGLDLEIVNPDPSIALIAFEGHEGDRSTLTIEGSNVHTQRGMCEWRHCCFWTSCYSIFVSLLVLGIIGLVSLSQLPHSTSTPPSFVLHRQSRSLTVVEFGLDSRWISAVNTRLDTTPNCFGTIHVIPGLMCDSLPTQTEQLTSNFQNLMYLLAGSQITVMVDPQTFQGDTVWVISSISAYKYAMKNYYLLPDDCSSDVTVDIYMQDYNCFEGDKYSTANPIVFNVERSDYYSLYVTDFVNGFRGLTYSVLAKTYNLTEINRISRPRSIEVQPGSAQQFYVNSPWKFSRDPLCVLFESSCVTQDIKADANLTVLDVRKRRDVLLFPSLFTFCMILVLILLIVVHVLRWRCVKMR